MSLVDGFVLWLLLQVFFSLAPWTKPNWLILLVPRIRGILCNQVEVVEDTQDVEKRGRRQAVDTR